ncbi:MAG: type II toxin-antitoxin system VapC family toxin [Gemmatimonadaceae bacterium]
MGSTVYLETTIPSYLAARPSRDLITVAHQQLTVDWWQSRRAGFQLYVSELVLQEAAFGDSELAQRRLAHLAGIPSLAITARAQALAGSLLSSGLLPVKAAADALHIGIAAANGVDYLLTWNIRHLANATIRRQIEDACRAAGFVAPVLCTSEELMEG